MWTLNKLDNMHTNYINMHVQLVLLFVPVLHLLLVAYSSHARTKTIVKAFE